MKKIAYILAAVAMPVMMGSCSDSFDANEAAGQGRLILRPTVSTDIKASRAVEGDQLEQLSQSCIIWISSEKGLVRKYDGIQNVPNDGIWLSGGQYTAEAWAGDSVPASFDSRYFKGIEPFNITAGGTVQVDLKCTIANTAVSVKYAEAIDDVLSDYTLTVGHSCGTLTWEGRDERRGYFMMNSRDKDLTYTLQGTKQDGSTFTLEGKIEAVKPTTEYILNVNYESNDVEMGGAFFTIEIDESTVDVAEEIEIISAPSIKGLYNVDLSQPVYGESKNMTRQGVYIAAATSLKSVLIKAPSLAEYINIEGGEIDLLRAHNDVLTSLQGIKVIRNRNEEQDLDNMKVTLEEELLNKLEVGEYDVEFIATVSVPVDDTHNVDKSNTAHLRIIITDAEVEAETIAQNDPTIWATEVTLTGKVMKDGVESVGFNYRPEGSTEWMHVDGEVISRATLSKGSSYTATLTGLRPGTTYEYVATSGSFTSTVVCKVTTEAATQLPNAGFEDWFMESGSRKPYYLAPSSTGFFWDSGNHGSCTLGVNITSPEENIKHSGKYSAKLASQKVAMMGIGAFAAGNVFIGEFLGTENTTKGILGWGRAWATRPRALKGYIKYTPEAITEVGGSPDGVTVNKGDMDAGIIYIGLVDNSTMSYGNYTGWPQIVATKDIKNYGFKSSDSKVIAYGEKIFTEATPGDGLIEFEIPLEYYRTDIKPSNIIITCSASRYGDYYTGGPSVMYLDDLELIY